MGLKISVVTTLYYSEGFVPEFYSRIKKALSAITGEYEIIFVNDGSPDASASVVLKLIEQDARLVLVDLSRNFGHHQAIMAGLSSAKGDFIFLIDSDLEEDPELLLSFWSVIHENTDVDVVYGIQQKRKGGFFERVSGQFFYKVLNLLTRFEYPANTLTARLMKRQYVDSVLDFKEKALDIWVIFILVGYNQKGILTEKKNKGSSTYTLRRKIMIGIDTITSFSHRPLYFIFAIGVLWSFLSIINISIILFKKWMYGAEVEGWASIMASLWLIGGVIIFLIGIVSIYLSKMFLEIKNRPTTIIKNIYRKS